MVEKPELIAFSQYKFGGIQSYFYNLLAYDPYQKFEKKWIFYDDDLDNSTKLPALYQCCDEVIFPINKIPNETVYQMAGRLEGQISDREGVILSSFYYELSTLHLHRRKNKTIIFFCHDRVYLNTARHYEFIIDVFIAHNIQYFDELKKLFPNRSKDIFYIPYGIPIRPNKRSTNLNSNLNLVVLSRMDSEKGVRDIPVLDEELRIREVFVEWTIIGDGPEKPALEAEMMKRGNCKFFSPPDNETVINLAKQCDIFVLPSRLDGLPVALLETMSVGCVPVISEFNYGIKSVVTQEEGFVLPIGNIKRFAETIELLNTDRALLKKLSEASRIKISREHDIRERAKEYYNLFDRYKQYKHSRRFRFHKYAGWLDYPFIPGTIKNGVNWIRNRVT